MLREASSSTHWGPGSQGSRKSLNPMGGSIWKACLGGVICMQKIASGLPPRTPRRGPAPCTPAPQNKAFSGPYLSYKGAGVPGCFGVGPPSPDKESTLSSAFLGWVWGPGACPLPPGPFLGWSLGPGEAPRSSGRGPREPQRSTKTAQGGPEMAQDDQNRLQDSLRRRHIASRGPKMLRTGPTYFIFTIF